MSNDCERREESNVFVQRGNVLKKIYTVSKTVAAGRRQSPPVILHANAEVHQHRLFDSCRAYLPKEREFGVCDSCLAAASWAFAWKPPGRTAAPPSTSCSGHLCCNHRPVLLYFLPRGRAARLVRSNFSAWGSIAAHPCTWIFFFDGSPHRPSTASGPRTELNPKSSFSASAQMTHTASCPRIILLDALLPPVFSFFPSR